MPTPKYFFRDHRPQNQGQIHKIRDKTKKHGLKTDVRSGFRFYPFFRLLGHIYSDWKSCLAHRLYVLRLEIRGEPTGLHRMATTFPRFQLRFNTNNSLWSLNLHNFWTNWSIFMQFFLFESLFPGLYTNQGFPEQRVFSGTNPKNSGTIGMYVVWKFCVCVCCQGYTYFIQILVRIGLIVFNWRSIYRETRKTKIWNRKSWFGLLKLMRLLWKVEF